MYCNCIQINWHIHYIPKGRTAGPCCGGFFLTKWGVPQCVRAIDGCHIPISAPVDNHMDYYNRKGWYSMILQGLVDENYCFLDICVGWLGSAHDARVFAHSDLYGNITDEELLPDKPIVVNGVNAPLILIGDSAYPLNTWLVKPFPQNGVLSREKKKLTTVQVTKRVESAVFHYLWIFSATLCTIQTCDIPT